MQYTRFFFLIFLIPALLLALDQNECNNLCNQALAEWNRTTGYIEQINRLGADQTETYIALLNDSIACCQRAISLYDTILNNLAQHSKKKEWRRDMKEQCKKNKETIIARLNDLQKALRDTLSFEKAKSLYKESLEKAETAKRKEHDCPRRLDNIDAVVASLNEVAKLYEEAAALANESFAWIAPSPREIDKARLQQTSQEFREAASRCKNEGIDWPGNVASQIAALKEKLSLLRTECRSLEEKGLKRRVFEVQKQMVSILKQIVDSGLEAEMESQEELALIKKRVELFAIETDTNRLTENAPSLSPEEFAAREQERRDLFFKSDLFLRPDLFLQGFLNHGPRPLVVPLDGQAGRQGKSYTLYTEQFYRFLVQSDIPISHFFVKVHKNGELIHEEKIILPVKHTLSWERYLTTDGMIFIPETKLKTDFGLDLRLAVVCDPKCCFSMIISQQGNHAGTQFSVSLDESSDLYDCTLIAPPPWQLEALRKPASPSTDKPISKALSPKITPFIKEDNDPSIYLEAPDFPILDQFVEELKQDPLLLAQYVYNEIAFIDPFLYQENGIFYPSAIHRNACTTFLEKQGSAWEQCQLLVYLLRKAGYQAFYAQGEPCALPKTFTEKMLFMQQESQEESLLKYPWVLFFDGNEWISLFPWMKEMQIDEGYDLYNQMPEEYASADRWILRYLKGDEKILKQIGSDGDDTAGVLFIRFIEEELRKKGLSIQDVGIHRVLLKKQFSSWKDFPSPATKGDPQIFESLDKEAHLFAQAIIEIFSHQNPQKKFRVTQPLAALNCTAFSIHFSPNGENNHSLHLGLGDYSLLLDLDQTDQTIDIKVSYNVPIGSGGFHQIQTLSMAKGTSAALCFHCGGSSSKMTSQFYQQFANEKDETKRLHALLAFIGAAYFEKCSRSEQTLANLHKVAPATAFAFGLAKLSPDLSKGSIKGAPDLKMPQVDMFWFQSQLPSDPLPGMWHQEIHTAVKQYRTLTTVDHSSNEHQILREIFEDPDAVSTVKLLQLAHLEHQKKGLPETGFLVFSPLSFETAEKTPEAAQSLYFSHLEDLNLREVKEVSSWQWDVLKNLFDPGDPLSSWYYAYMTSELIWSQGGSYKEMGTLILGPYAQYALISSNNLVFHGGLGSPLPSSYFTSFAIREWQLVLTNNSYTLQIPNQFIPSSILALPQSLPGKTEWSSDVRPEHKSLLNSVADPVDIVSGAFYVDEVDLFVPGSFPLEIRRNYNSQNPLIGDFGCGWKLSLNPFLVEQDGKRFAAEADGTVISYSYNQQTSRWEVFPEDNPDLWNFNQKGIGSSANPFHAYIENDLLYGSDGSKRFFEEGLLKKWVNAKGITLTFSYEKGRLSRIESSNGDFCGLHYNHEDKISEIYARDGRRISYDYNSQGDLVKVTLPNTAVISYEYDRAHRVIRETKPHGKVLENIYDDKGRVKEQRSPMGPQQEMVTTATFEYADGETIVTDAGGGKTTYKIFEKQIYKVTDPLGYHTLQSWFITEKLWFDAETEQIVEWNQKGGAIRSLKTTTDKRGLTTYYLYDNRGNPEEIGLKGDDLTGSGESVIAKKRAYNDHDLCIQEEVCGQKTVTTYDSLFPYLPKRIEKYSGNALTSYIDFDYNSLGQLEKEDYSGSITIWKYNDRGFPREKIQVTGTEDPDVVTTYAYNQQGQCIKITSVNGTQENAYDIMGNQIESKTLSPAGELISATYIGYDLNNAPIWKQTANAENIVYFDYHASGLIKAKRESLAPSRCVAYSLYEYNHCGYLTEETDPRGYVTYRDHDPVGRVKAETKEGHTTLFSYEAGGLVESITSPSGAQVTRHYTTNGLLKEEIYPDGTKDTTVYDFWGRPILETKNDISWEIKYDDIHHRVTRTHLKTKNQEISEFDSRGNLIRFIDAAGYTSEKTYDGLNRLKTETTPSGKQTFWSYQNDLVICTFPSGETTTTQYAGGRAVKSEVTDSRGILIAVSQFHFDPENDKEEVLEGEERTVTWRNALGLPIKIEKGEITVENEYDSCGNCIISIDGDGRITRQEFDGLDRLTRKQLPDGSVIEFVYDLDSNLAEYHLPNGNVWKASYDSMHRKKSEELLSSGDSSGHWTFSYEGGYLVRATDPMQRTHTYLYDSYGRIFQDIVEGGRCTYTYEPRGYLATIDQTTDIPSSQPSGWVCGSQSENSLIERSYDADGHLAVESVYLNSHLVQQTQQKWSANSRSLQIGDHFRDFLYQNNQLVQVSTQHVGVAYSYYLSGSLKSKNSRLSCTTIDYNVSGLPDTILTRLPEGSYQEQLDWYPSGKLYTYAAPGREQSFSYSDLGYLKSTGSEKYDFDFGSTGTGVRTAAPGWYVPQNGLDDFGRILASIFEKTSLSTGYNAMGEVITHGQRQLSWDPWGRLIKVTDSLFSWEASYDALDRRIQTRYTKSGEQTLVTNSFYDPEEEFQEIGVQVAGKTFWKIYGPDACDAISDETGASVALMYNALRQLTGVVSHQGTLYSEKLPSVYGPLETTSSVVSDLISYAQSLNWHSKAQDPTGFIWMGDRYYDARNGQFLSQDLVSYPSCLNLYAYANGDPINYFDPDGRFASSVYQPIKATFLDVVNSPRFNGAWQMFGGAVEMGAGGGMAYGSGGLAAPVGFAVFAHGADHFSTGFRTLLTGRYGETATSQLLQKTGMSVRTADFIDSSMSMGGTMGGAAAIQCARAASSAAFRLPQENIISLPTYTKSNLQLGQQMHNSYKLGVPGMKEYRLPSGRRIDFLDPANSIIYELKPNNPRAIRVGQKQLELYLQEIKTVPRYKDMDWKTILETY